MPSIWPTDEPRCHRELGWTKDPETVCLFSLVAVW